MRKRLCVMLLMGVLAYSGCSQEASTDELVDDLSSADVGDRVKAVRWLQNRQGDAAKAVPALIKALKDPADNVRISAAVGLGYYGADAEEALPALEEMLQDGDGKVREAARVAISRINGKN